MHEPQGTGAPQWGHMAMLAAGRVPDSAIPIV